VALRDPRQRADTLARGQYPVGLGPGLADVQILVDDGFHIEIVQLEDVPGYTSGAFGVLGVVEGAPHPKAGQLFANWLLSREGLAIYSRTQREVGMRNDINYAEWIPDFAIPKPGVHYLNTYTWEFKGQQQPAAQQKLRELLGGS
jgi:ABC-type Fe3+ transport system substrate-binding protein